MTYSNSFLALDSAGTPPISCTAPTRSN